LSQLPPVVHKVRGKASQAASQAPNICILWYWSEWPKLLEFSLADWKIWFRWG
jgi:hypothetical protein